MSSMRRRPGRSWRLWAVCASLLAFAAAEPGVGTIKGKVRAASSGAAVAGATVEAAGVKTQSAADGSFTLAKVPAGKLTLSCRAPGYRALKKTVTLAAGATLTLDLALQPEPPDEDSEAEPAAEPAPPPPAAKPAARSSASDKKASKGDAAGAMGLGALGSAGSGSGAGGGGAGMGTGKGMGAPAPAKKSKAGGPKPPSTPPPVVKPSESSTPPRPTAAKPTVKFLSADDSNSCASPAIARKLIEDGRYVSPELVRTYEFLNYYTFDYPAPRETPIGITAELRALGKDAYDLQIAVRGPDRARAEMLPLHATLVLDTSGSMAGAPYALARNFVTAFVEQLRPEERVTLVTFNRTAKVALPPTRRADLDLKRFQKMLTDELVINDITDLEQGLALAYETAGKSYQAGHANRVILISDGAANAGKKGKALIAKHAEDSERQGIYLTGIALGDGFDDSLMNTVTDRGRGAYVFLDRPSEVGRLLGERNFVATFDVAVKDVRLKMVMPPGWTMKEFHGEQIADTAAEIVPQYLSPNDQMIYHMTISTTLSPAERDAGEFEFEAEYRPIPGAASTATAKRSVAAMLGDSATAAKGGAVVRYAEVLKKIAYPFAEHKEKNLAELAAAAAEIGAINARLNDAELAEILALLGKYETIARHGEQWATARDQDSDDPAAVLGLDANTVRKVTLKGGRPDQAIRALMRLRNSNRLLPLEGYKFLAVGSGPIGSAHPAGGGQLSGTTIKDPAPDFLGNKPLRSDGRRVYDCHQVVLELTAPQSAKSFSFDFNFFSAEYPQYVNANYNDTFYAVLEAPSTNAGKPTNISFDPRHNSIEVDNNYFEAEFHPIPNTGTGFDPHGSTGWLRTTWPVRGGEPLRLTFSVHDEGDAVFDSVAVLDNFRWHEFDAVGTTDPLN